MAEKPVEISRRARAEVDARTVDAVDAYADGRAELDRRSDEPPRPGDLYVVAQATEEPLEWLVVDTESAGRDRLLVVPADPQSLVGSADVAVADDEPGGPLALRCGHGAEIDVALLDAEMRTGSVADETLDRVRDKRQQLADGQLRASTEQVETDADPEYAMWIEDVVAPARAALAGRPRTRAVGRPQISLVPETAEGSATEPRMAPATAPVSQPWHRRLVKVAALPLAACLAWLLAGTPGWRQDPEVAMLMLAMGTRTGGEPSLTLAAGTEHVELRVDLGGDDDYQSFRASLATLEGVEVWRGLDLAQSATEWGSEVIILLPAELLATGDYELALEGVGADGEVSEVGFYSFRVRFVGPYNQSRRDAGAPSAGVDGCNSREKSLVRCSLNSA